MEPYELVGKSRVGTSVIIQCASLTEAKHVAKGDPRVWRWRLFKRVDVTHLLRAPKRKTQKG